MMNSKCFRLIIALLMLSTQALAGIPELYKKINDDFKNKDTFKNAHINDFRDGVMSPFMSALYGDEANNNARPLPLSAVSKLMPEVELEYKIFKLAMEGRRRLLVAKKIKDHPILTIVDFTIHSRGRRLYMMNVHTGEMILNTWVAHAGGSDSDGDGYPETFSNVPGSNLSSLGFMKGNETYTGMWGYSLRLDGLDPILNDKVRPRAVVMHGFGGLNASDLAYNRASTSLGCLMLSFSESGRFWGLEDVSLNDLVINRVKGGGLVFAYSDVEDATGTPEIFKSTWIKPSDLPAEEPETQDEPEIVPETEQVPVQETIPEPPKTEPKPVVNPPAKNPDGSYPCILVRTKQGRTRVHCGDPNEIIQDVPVKPAANDNKGTEVQIFRKLNPTPSQNPYEYTHGT